MGGIKDVANRPNHAGTTPLHEACRTGDSWKVFLLWNAGAEPRNDKNGEKPDFEDHLKKYALIDKTGMPFRPVPQQEFGIQHILDFNSSQVDPLFKAWTPSNKLGEPEQKILQLFEQFGVNVLSVATDDMDPKEADKVMEKIRMWNSSHEKKLLATAPPVDTSLSLGGHLFNLCGGVCNWCERVCSNKKGVFSDRNEAEEDITAINIKKIGGVITDGWPTDIRLRYGDTWAPWRRCGGLVVGDKEEMPRLGSNEGINRLSGYSYDFNGITRSLEATTTTRRTWGPHGNHTPDGLVTLRSSPDADNLTLRFISGDQTTHKWILRFHWEATPSMV